MIITIVHRSSTVLGLLSEGHGSLKVSMWGSKDKNKNQMQIDFVNLDQSLGSLLSEGSLSAYLKHSTIWKRFTGYNHSNSRCTIKLEVWLHRNSFQSAYDYKGRFYSSKA